MGIQNINIKLLMICFAVFASVVPSWSRDPPVHMQIDKNKVFPGLRLSLLSQRWRPQENISEMDRRAIDVFEVGRDDILARFRLANEGDESLYYLAPLNSMEPTGYILFRKAGVTNWKATSPAYGREGSFTGGGYQWLLLPPGAAIEFEFLDLSTRPGEHAISLLVNSKSSHAGRAEYVSAPYAPIKH